MFRAASWRDESGWASVELALITPALLFVAFVLGVAISAAGDRARVVVAAHDGALAAMRMSSAADVQTVVTSELAGMRDIKVVVDDVSTSGNERLLRVCVDAHRPLPRPFAAASSGWRECATVLAAK